MGWEEFVKFLQGPGVSVVVGVILALLVEYWPQFQNLEPKQKQLAFAGLSLVIPLAGALAACLSGFSAWADWAGLWWPALVAGWTAFFSGTMGHQADSAIRKLIA